MRDVRRIVRTWRATFLASDLGEAIADLTDVLPSEDCVAIEAMDSHVERIVDLLFEWSKRESDGLEEVAVSHLFQIASTYSRIARLRSAVSGDLRDGPDDALDQRIFERAKARVHRQDAA